MIWVLTTGINDYRQKGNYFVAAWTEKPSRDEVRAIIVEFEGPHWVESILDQAMDLTLPRKACDRWFDLIQVRPGQMFTLEDFNAINATREEACT